MPARATPAALPRVRGRSPVALADALLVLPAAVIGYFAATSNGPQPAGTTAAGLAVILIVLPLLARRVAPVAGLAAVLGADLVNVAAFGQHTRCAVVLPITAYLGFAACRRAPDRRVLAAPLALMVAIGAVTCVFEVGLSGVPACVLVLGGAALLARMVRRRDLLVEQLERESQALQAQRDQTARLAVETERSRIGDDLAAGVQERVAGILRHADAGRASDPESFAAIEREGRAGLTQMRAVVAGLSPAPAAPQPSLAELDALIAAQRARAVLRIDGERRPLAPGIEVAACKIVELLLGVVDPGDHGVSVEVRYGGDTLEVGLIAVRGEGPAPDPGAVAAARARAAAVGGSIQVGAQEGQTRARILLPVAVGA